MKKTVSFGVIAATCVMIFSGCSGNTTAVKGEALDQSATSQRTSATKTPKTVTSSGTTAKQTKEPSSSMANQTNKTASTTISQPTMEHMKSALETIYFDFDSDALSELSRQTLTSNADYLQKHSDVSIRIEGNCDERGSAEYNIALGEKRAKAAMKYITTLGIADNRLSIVSYGKEKAIEQGHDESSWAKNRRDDFAIQSK